MGTTAPHKRPGGSLPSPQAIAALEREDLIDLWRRVHRAPPPKHLSLPILRQALSYEVQCRSEGGPTTALLRALKAKPAAARATAPAPSLPLGARLIREWNGRRYDVEVIEGGIRCDGQVWPSLTALARHITGTHWSGPRFFGLTRRTGSTPPGGGVGRSTAPIVEVSS